MSIINGNGRGKNALRLVWIFIIALIAAFALFTIMNYYARGQAREEVRKHCLQDRALATNQRTELFGLLRIVSAESTENHPSLADPTVVTQLQEALDRIPEYDC